MVGMSGGVDSSVTAALLLEEGYEVIGATLKLLNSDAQSTVEDAKEVASRLGIKHIVLDYKKEFSDHVVDYFVSEYLKGRTPNPCTVCNMKIKFGFMLDYALKIGCTHLATGHYANVIYDENLSRWLLKKSNSSKDQTYFLYGLNQHQLSHAIFPLSNLEKPRVRELAEKYGLFVAHKKESQDICFIKNGNHAQFIEKYKGIKPASGAFVDTSGNLLGVHKGIINYTVGQRRHLGVSLGVNMYVKSINAGDNSITLSEHLGGRCQTIIGNHVSCSAFESFESETRVLVKTRSRAKEVPCKVSPLDESRIKIEFEDPQYFPAPGQSAVFYDERGCVLGGARIDVVGKE